MAGGRPSVEWSPFVTPTQLFSSIFHLSQKADEAGRNLGASPGLASLCATIDGVWGGLLSQVLPLAVLFGGKNGCEGFRKSSVTCF